MSSISRITFTALLSVTILFAGGRIDQPRAGKIKGAFRAPVRSGWIFVHLEGAPFDVGYQHGFLMAPEIDDTFQVIQMESVHDTNKDWPFFRQAAQDVLWPKIEKEYREELQGIVAGLAAKGVKVDIWDLVAMNASLELGPYYIPFYDKQQGIPSAVKPPVPERCSSLGLLLPFVECLMFL